MNFSKLLSLQGYFELSHKLKSLLNLSNDLPSSRPDSQTSAGFVKFEIMPSTILIHLQDQKPFIGPQGLDVTITAFYVHIEIYPTHMGSLPVALNLQCHCHRHKEAIL